MWFNTARIMMVRLLILSIVFILHNAGLRAQVPVPGKALKGTVLLKNGIAHLGNGEVINSSAVAFKDGKLSLVADATIIKLNPNEFDTIINLNGKHIYPGFIAPNSTLGLYEIDAVRATRDGNETGEINPNVRSIIAYNTESRITPTVRSNGVLIAQITPRGGLISGSSSIVTLDAWNWEDAVVTMDDGIHLNWPVIRYHRRKPKPGSTPPHKQFERKREVLRSFFEKAQAYNKGTYSSTDLKLKSMAGLFDGSKTLYIHVQGAKGISQAIEFSKEFAINKMVIVGGRESWMVLDLLHKNNIPVILHRIHSLPTRYDDPIDLPYRLPKILHDAGILFCLENSGDMERMGARNLPFYAGTAAAYGLSKENALQSITYNTAQILGLEESMGSLEVGKDATLFVSTGDALDMRTNNVELAFIKGRVVDMDNHQKALYRKYRAKYKDQ
jgi:imidazolonepropionase-like amidohydrolase